MIQRSIITLLACLVGTTFAPCELAAQSLILKSTFETQDDYYLFSADFENDRIAEFVAIKETAITIYDASTKAARYTVVLDPSQSENVWTDDIVSGKLRNKLLVQDFNGNGVRDLFVTGVDGQGNGYLRLVDCKTGEELLRERTSSDTDIEAIDTDGNGTLELIITRSDGDRTVSKIYSTNARLTSVSVGRSPSSNMTTLAPNPAGIQGCTISWDSGLTVSRLSLYDAQGNLVRRFVAPFPDESIAYWDAKNGSGELVSSGVYLMSLETNRGTIDEVLVLAH